MVHLLALPGAPNFAGDIKEVYNRAKKEALTLQKTGFDGIIVENFNDAPFNIDSVGLNTTTAIAGIVSSLRETLDIPIGVNVQFNDNESEIAIASTCGGQFVRVEVFIENVVTPQGIVEASSSEIMRDLKDLGFGQPLIFSDILSKGTTRLVEEDSSVAELANKASKAGADVVLLTGKSTGNSMDLTTVESISTGSDLPIFVGSGVKHNTVGKTLEYSEGVIVGSALKKEGEVENRVLEERASDFVNRVREK